MSNNEILDLSVENKIIKEIKSVDFESGNDFEFARKNMKALIEKGQYALDNLLNLADQSQQFEGYDTVSALLKTLIDGNKQLMNVKKVDKEIESMGNSDNKETTLVNNNLYITPTDLLDAVISNRLKEKEESKSKK